MRRVPLSGDYSSSSGKAKIQSRLQKYNQSGNHSNGGNLPDLQAPGRCACQPFHCNLDAA